MAKYTQTELKHIANQCAHFDHVIQAMGYGFSLLNVSPDTFIEQCDYCVHWANGDCEIFQEFQARKNSDQKEV